MKKTATVIIPVFNREACITRALDSVRNQKYRPIELIIVDDASTDKSWEKIIQWIESNSSDDFNVYTIRNHNNRGPAASRNLGINQATGNFIYFLDSDDQMAPSLLTLSICALEESEAECVIFGFEFVSNLSSTPATWFPPDQSALRSFLQNKLWGYTYTSVKRTSLVRRIGYWNEDARVAEDYEFLGRALLESAPPILLRKVLLTAYSLPDSLGAQKMTEVGLRDRLACEQAVVTKVLERRKEIPATWLTEYSDRLMTTSLRTMAQGKVTFAREMKSLAASVRSGHPTVRQRLRSAVVDLGPLPCRSILALARLLRFVTNNRRQQHLNIDNN